ncbi:MAG: dTMP kinase [Candidatus Spechtbacterales bacterium]
MFKNPYKGKFFAFEGPDGSGQSTQVAKLAKYLERLHKKDPEHYPAVYVTKEPSTGVFGGFIREALRGRWSHGPLHGPLLMQALFVADRAHHLEHEVIPELEKGHTVITDRYAFSTIAYGAAENSALWDCLVAMNETFFEPNVTIFLDVSANFCMGRMKRTRGHLELYEKRETLKRVLTNYRKLAKMHSSMRIVDGERSVGSVFAAIKKIAL